MKNFLIAYDIFNKKRLFHVRKITYSYSLGGQKSALEMPYDKSLIKDFISEINDVISPEDKLNIIKTFDKPILLGKASKISIECNGIVII